MRFNKLKIFAEKLLFDADAVFKEIKSKRKNRTPVDLVISFLRESSILFDAYANAANRYAKMYPEFMAEITRIGCFCRTVAEVIRDRAKTMEIAPTNFVTGLDVILTRVEGQMVLIHKTCLGIIADINKL